MMYGKAKQVRIRNLLVSDNPVCKRADRHVVVNVRRPEFVIGVPNDLLQ